MNEHEKDFVQALLNLTMFLAKPLDQQLHNNYNGINNNS